MNIQHYGDFCFKITTKPEGRATEDVIIWTDPLLRGDGLRSPQGEPDVLLLSHATEERIGTRKKDVKSIVLDMPGEFSVRSIAITGHDMLTKDQGFNTVYLLDTEDMQIAYLGHPGTLPSAELIDKMSGVDVLFLPVPAGDGWDEKVALDALKKIEPKIVILMHFAQEGLTKKGLNDAQKFANQFSGSSEVISKLSLKKKDVVENIGKVYIFS